MYAVKVNTVRLSKTEDISGRAIPSGPCILRPMQAPSLEKARAEFVASWNDYMQRTAQPAGRDWESLRAQYGLEVVRVW